MEYYGYAGQILHVDLSRRKVTKEQLDIDMGRDFIGGMGLGIRLAYDLIPPGIEALSPDNPIIIGTGVLTGTLAPGAAKTIYIAKLPLTNAIGVGAGALDFGGMLKWAGYDNLVITGRSEKPVYLKISDDIEICDARHLWGKDTHETTHELWKEYGRAGVICIGQAGENLVKGTIAFVDNAATLGRGGLGALMGSKNLKAIVARGTKGIKIKDKKTFLRLMENSVIKKIRKYWDFQRRVDYGYMAHWDKLAPLMYGTRDWDMEKITELYGPDVYDKIRRERVACLSCAMADKEFIEVRNGEYKGLEKATNSFIGFPDIATRFHLKDYRETAKLYDMLDRYGICILTFQTMADYVVTAFETGEITEKDTGGMILSRDFKTLMDLIEKITFRKGFGDLLADGWGEVGKKLSIKKRPLVVKGQDVIFDPRETILGTFEFESIVNPRGTDMKSAGTFTWSAAGSVPVEVFRSDSERMGSPPDQIERTFDSSLGFNVGRLTVTGEHWHCLMTSMGMCQRGAIQRYWDKDSFAEAYSAATGLKTNGQELIKAAERSWNLYRVLNVRQGFSRKDDAFPEDWFEPIIRKDGKKFPLMDYYKKKILTKDDTNQLLNDYYDERGWDQTTGIPTREKLEELGLGWVEFKS